MSFDLGKLGVKKNIPKVNFTEYSGILSAPPKWGKTTMASMYPNAILLAFEKGYKAQSVNVKDINEWEDFVEFVDLLEDHREEIADNIQTIIIDTVNEAYLMAEPYMCKKESIKDGKKYRNKKDIPYGQGWNLHDSYFREQISRIYALGFEITYITHSQVKTFRPKDGEEYDVYKTSMPDRLENIIFPECDYILYGQRIKIDDGNGNKVIKRMMTTRGTDDLEAGNRVYLSEDIIFDTEEEAMAKFQKLFRESIENNLHKAGIIGDIDQIAKQQKQEKQQQINEYLEEKNAIDVEKNEELIKQIAVKVQSTTEVGKQKMKEIMKKNDITSFKDTEVIKTSALEEIVSVL